MADLRIDELLDKLIRSWTDWETSRFYVEKLVPAIVRDDRSIANLSAFEREVVDELRKLLGSGGWPQLPQLVEERQGFLAGEAERKREQVRVADAVRLAEAERQAAIEEAEERRHRKIREQVKRESGARDKRAGALRSMLMDALDADFLGADDVYRCHPDAALLNLIDFEALKCTFVHRWAARELGIQLDREQALAVATAGVDVRVTARAGSGKTRTLVTRALFLIKHCRIPPRNLLLLAFNRRAANEILDRVSLLLDGELPYVMTFHALAYALVHPEEEILFDDATSDTQALSQAVQDVIDEHLRDPVYGEQIRGLMLQYFREDWEAIVAGGYHLTMDELLLRRRAAPRETLRGEYVKSHGEKTIANILFEHGIPYAYEKNRLWNGVNYRPDFTISGPTGVGGVVIEYFGLVGEPGYDTEANAKRQYWGTQKGWTLLEYTPRDVTGDAEEFAARLLLDLESMGLNGQRLSDEQIWELISRRAVDRFTSAVKTFVTRCRKRGLSPEAVAAQIETHVASSPSEGAFLQIAESVHRSYLARLVETDREDFDGLMWRAVDLIRSGDTRFARRGGRERGDLASIQYVHIDEFQDFSKMFFEMVTGIRQASATAEFFCVGDDWQAINAFAGSELRFFTEFDRYFEKSITREIRTNYRSPRSIVDFGNALMVGKGSNALAHQQDMGLVWRCNLNEFRPSAAEEERHAGDQITPSVLRLVQHFINLDQDVVLLSRRNSVPWYVNYRNTSQRSTDVLERYLAEVRSYLPEEDRRRVTISTTHKYKGLEKAAVIVLDAVDDSYPLIHQNWVFLRMFGDSPETLEAEEKRLFYVAVTRAMSTLALIAEERRASPFLIEVEAQITIPRAPWPSLESVSAAGDPRVEIRVFQAYDVKEHLKNTGFRWSQNKKFWWRRISASLYTDDYLLAKPWFVGAVEVEVLADSGAVLRCRSTR